MEHATSNTRAPVFQKPRVDSATAARVRYSGCVVAAVTMLLVPGVEDRLRYGLLITLVAYTVLAQMVSWLEKYLSTDVTMVMQAILGIAVLASATFLAGSNAEAVLIAYPCMPLYYTFLSGRVLGTIVAIVVALTAFIVMVTTGDISGLAFGAFVAAESAVLLVSAYMVTERTDVTNRLERLRDALRQVSQVPTLDPTLESIITAIENSAQSLRACILLKSGDRLRIAAPQALSAQQSDELVEIVTSRELGDYESSLGRAVSRLSNGTTVLHPRQQEHPWISELLDDSFSNSEVVALVPLAVSGVPIGVLVVAADSTADLDLDEIEVLEIYAEQAAIVIVRAQAYEESQRAAVERERADQLKSEFLSMVSHELRSPLSSVKGWISTVRRHWERFDDDRRLELLERAEANADELTRLIDQLLDFSRIESDRFELRWETFPLADLVADVNRDLEPVLDGHSVILDVPAEVAVHADRHAVRHILVNLISNAVKFSGERSAVAVRAEAQDDWVQVTVIDHGVGIPFDDLERIFERFVQLEGAPHRARRGTGIGLAIARKFTEAHGGRIWATSQLGLGSSFRFTIPATPERSSELPKVAL